MTSNQVDNQRQFVRMDVKIVTELRSAGDVKIVGESSDISLDGLFLQCETTLPVGTDCEATLVLDRGSEKGSIKVLGKVTRITQTGMGVQFTENLSEDSVGQLVAWWNPGKKERGERA